jgi:hypothetical protein
MGGGSAVALGLLYSLTVHLLQAGGAEPVVKPSLPIRRERYYAWLRFLTLPTFLAMWLSFSRIAQRTARALGGRGHDADTRALSGVALSLPVFITMWVPETIMALLLVRKVVSWNAMRDWGNRGPGLAFHNTRQIAGVLWMLALGAIALREVNGLSWPRAVLATLAGSATSGALGALVIR